MLKVDHDDAVMIQSKDTTSIIKFYVEVVFPGCKAQLKQLV